MAVLAAENVSYTYQSKYQKVQALKNVSCTFEAGKFYAIIGQSGSGKTTLLSMLAGLGTPSEGEIIANGKTLKEIGSERHRRENVTVIYQSFNLFPTLNILENIMYPMQISKKPTKEAKVRAKELLNSVGLGDVDPRKLPAMLSGGQQQRVAIARALSKRPDVLLLDEPLSNLDAKLRVEMREEIRRIQREAGITTVFVTHDQEEALAVADRIGVMNKGKIEQIAAPQNLYQRPASEYVATFIGLTNRLPGASNGDEAVVFGQRVPLLAGSAKGDSVAVLVRPENLMLALAGSSDSHVGERARVEVIHFLGSLVRVDTVITSGEYQRWNKGEQLKATVQLPASELLAGLAVGDDVIVTPRPVAALAC